MRQKRKLASLLGLSLLASCHTVAAVGEAFAALPEEQATKLLEAPMVDLEALLSLLLRVVRL